jgi:hypothetical protein
MTMAIVYIQEFEIGDRSTENYDFVKERVGQGPFEGLIVHTAGFDDANGVFRIVDVWESREDFERFDSEKIQPMIAKGPEAFPRPDTVTPPTREGTYELHDLVQQ